MAERAGVGQSAGPEFETDAKTKRPPLRVAAVASASRDAAIERQRVSVALAVTMWPAWVSRSR